MPARRPRPLRFEPIVPQQVDIYDYTDVRRYLQEVMYEQVRMDFARGQRVHTQPWWSKGAWVSIGAVNALFAGIKIVRGKVRARRGDDGTPQVYEEEEGGVTRVGRRFFPEHVTVEGDGTKTFRMETLMAFRRLIMLYPDEEEYFHRMVDAHCARHVELRQKAVDAVHAAREEHLRSIERARTGLFRSWIAQSLMLFLELSDAPADAAKVPDWFLKRSAFPADRAAVAEALRFLTDSGIVQKADDGTWKRVHRVMVLDPRETQTDKAAWDAYAEGLNQFHDLAKLTLDDWHEVDGVWQRRNDWHAGTRWVSGTLLTIPADKFTDIRDMLEGARDRALLAQEPERGDTVVRLNLQLFVCSHNAPKGAAAARPATGTRAKAAPAKPKARAKAKPKRPTAGRPAKKA